MIQIRHRFALLATIALLGGTNLALAAGTRGAAVGTTGGAAVTVGPASNAATPTGVGVGSTISGNPPSQDSQATQGSGRTGVSGPPSCTTSPSTDISAANSGQTSPATDTGANLNGSATTGSGSSSGFGC